MKVTICDRCANVMTDSSKQISVGFNHPLAIRGYDSPPTKYTLDICPDCFEEIQRWVAGYAFEVKDMRKDAKP